MNSMIQNQHKLSIAEIVSFGICLLFSFLSFGQNTKKNVSTPHNQPLRQMSSLHNSLNFKFLFSLFFISTVALQTVAQTSPLCGIPDTRVFAAQAKKISGTVKTPEKAVDHFLYSGSELHASGIIGFGAAKIEITFDHLVPAGTPLYLRLRSGDKTVAVGGGLTFKPIAENNERGIEASSEHNAIWGVARGGVTYETSFIPSKNLGGLWSSDIQNIPYKGVEITLGTGLAGLGLEAEVFEVYYYKKTQITNDAFCESITDVKNIFSGSKSSITGGETNFTTGVSNEYFAIDGNPETYATLQSGATTLTTIYLDVEFNTPFLKNDLLEIEFSRQSGLEIDFWSSITIQRFLDETPVGATISQGTFLSLFSAGRANVIVPPFDQPFNKVRIAKQLGAGWGANTEIYEISRKVDPKSIIDNALFDETIGYILKKPIDCKGGIRLNNNANDGCTTYRWYDENNAYIGEGFEVDVPDKYAGGTHTFYLQPVRYNCEKLARTAVQFTVNKCTQDQVLSNPTLTSQAKG